MECRKGIETCLPLQWKRSLSSSIAEPQGEVPAASGVGIPRRTAGQQPSVRAQHRRDHASSQPSRVAPADQGGNRLQFSAGCSFSDDAAVDAAPTITVAWLNTARPVGDRRDTLQRFSGYFGKLVSNDGLPGPVNCVWSCGQLFVAGMIKLPLAESGRGWRR